MWGPTRQVFRCEELILLSAQASMIRCVWLSRLMDYCGVHLRWANLLTLWSAKSRKLEAVNEHDGGSSSRREHPKPSARPDSKPDFPNTPAALRPSRNLSQTLIHRELGLSFRARNDRGSLNRLGREMGLEVHGCLIIISWQ